MPFSAAGGLGWSGDIDWTDVREADLPPELRDLAESVVGSASAIEAASRIVEAFGGSSVYVPALRDLRRRTLAARARRLWRPEAREGRGNAGEVCRALGVSRRHLAALLRG